MDRTTFGEWLTSQITERGMKPADLSRLSSLDSAVISNLINGKRNAGIDTCKAIARALRLPVVEVLRAAGIIENEPENDPIVDRVTNLLIELDNSNKREVLEYVKLRHTISTQNDHARNSKRMPRRPAAT